MILRLPAEKTFDTLKEQLIKRTAVPEQWKLYWERIRASGIQGAAALSTY